MPRKPKPPEPLRRKPHREWFEDELVDLASIVNDIGSKDWIEVARQMALQGWDRTHDQCRIQWGATATRRVMPRWSREMTIAICARWSNLEEFNRKWEAGRYDP